MRDPGDIATTPNAGDFLDANLRLLAALVSGQAVPAQLWSDRAVDLIELARRHNLVPMLWRGLKLQGVEMREGDWLPLRTITRLASARYLRAQFRIKVFDRAAQTSGVKTIWLKGAALAHTVYPDPTLRPMADLDVLVPYAARHTALAVAQSLGYRAKKPELFHGYDDLLHHYHLLGPAAGSEILEVHYRLLSSADELLTPQHLEWFWGQIQVCHLEDLTLTIFRPEAHLLYLCAHAILQHGESEFVLQRYFDMHLLVTRYPDLDWACVVEQAAAFGWTYAVERALALTQEYFETPLPPSLLVELVQRRRKGEAVAHAGRARPANDWEFDLHQLGVLRGTARLRMALGLALPKPTYMRWRYQIDATWKLPWYYLRRLTGMVPHIIQSISRRLPGRG